MSESVPDRGSDEEWWQAEIARLKGSRVKELESLLKEARDELVATHQAYAAGVLITPSNAFNPFNPLAK